MIVGKFIDVVNVVAPSVETRQSVGISLSDSNSGEAFSALMYKSIQMSE